MELQPSRSAATYTARLDSALKQLQDRVKEQEAVLEKVWSCIIYVYYPLSNAI